MDIKEDFLMNNKRSDVVQEPEESLADLTSLKADLRNLYRRLQRRGPFCRTKTVRQEVFELLKLYHAWPE